ncbi:hypothetical protein ABK040_004429 [Willaertia magna]
MTEPKHKNLTKLTKVDSRLSVASSRDSNTIDPLFSPKSPTVTSDVFMLPNENQSVNNQESGNKFFNCLCSLRVSTLIILILTFTLMLMIFVVIISSIFATSFSELEKKDVSNTSKRIMKSLKDALDSIYKVLYPYSAWDDTFYATENVVNRGYKEDWDVLNEFMDVNFAEDVMSSIDINFATLYSLNGTILSYRTSLNAELDLTLFNNFPYFHLIKDTTSAFEKLGGILFDKLSNQMMLYVITPVTLANPVETSDKIGWLFFGKYVSEKFMNDIADSVQCCVSFHILKDLNDEIVNKFKDTSEIINGTVPDINSMIWKNNEVFGYDILTKTELSKRHCGVLDKNLNGSIITEQRYATYQYVTDTLGNNLFISRVDIPRSVYFVGLQSLLLAIFLLFGVCLFSTFVVIIFIERRVLSRIIKLTNRIQQITVMNDSKQRIEKDNSFDELGNVVININRMLDALDNLLEQSKEQQVIKKLFERIAQVEETTKNILNGIKDVVLTVDLNGNILFANTSFYDQFGFKNSEIEGVHNVSVCDIFPELLNTINNLSNSKLDEIYNKNPTVEKKKELIGQILISLADNNFHLLRASARKKNEHIEFECLFTKSKVVISNVDTKVYVVVARKISNRFSQNSSSTNIQSSHSEESEEMENMLNEFDKMLLDIKEREKFKEYCKQERSEENILFIEQVLEYKQLKQPHERMIKQEYIVNNFLLNNSLNISSDLMNREVVRIQKGLGQIDLFDQLLVFVQTVVCKDTFMRYKQQQHDLMYL